MPKGIETFEVKTLPMGKREVTVLDWAQFHAANVSLAKKIREQAAPIDLVLAINRGGAVSGVFISHLLGVSEMLTFSLQLRQGDAVNAVPGPGKLLGTEVFAHLNGRRVLLIDDVVGTGSTFVRAHEALKDVRPASLQTAATIWNMEDHPDCPADFYGATTPGWVAFPWEDNK